VGRRISRLEFELSLTLLVLGVFANNTNDAAAMDHLALVTDLLYGSTNLHFFS
jgi:hypothetical protein